jgi:hypothetical protein
MLGKQGLPGEGREVLYVLPVGVELGLLVLLDVSEQGLPGEEVVLMSDESWVLGDGWQLPKPTRDELMEIDAVFLLAGLAELMAKGEKYCLSMSVEEYRAEYEKYWQETREAGGFVGVSPGFATELYATAQKLACADLSDVVYAYAMKSVLRVELVRDGYGELDYFEKFALLAAEESELWGELSEESKDAAYERFMRDDYATGLVSESVLSAVQTEWRVAGGRDQRNPRSVELVELGAGLER